MKSTEKPYVESLEEMVFKNRNKEYGSYQIRRKYRKYILISTLTGLFLMVSAVAYPFVESIFNKGDGKTPLIANYDPKMIPPPTVPPPPPPPPPATPPPKVVQFKPVASKDSITKFVAILPTEFVNTPPPTTPPVTVQKPPVIVAVAQKPDEPLLFVAEMPTFNGNVSDYLSAQIKYPQAAAEIGAQGRVICQFIVNADGSISDVEVVRSVYPLLDKEAVRVIKSMPKWNPGKQNDKAVRVKFTLPVNFQLKD